MSDGREALFDELFDIAAKYNVALTNSPAMNPGVPEIGDFCGDVEAAVLAAGYRRPRTVTTVEELDALPEGTVIRDASGVVRDRFNDSETDAALWLRPGASGWMLSRNFGDKNFPATVLHEPEPQP